jgi:hypothetical protein
MCVDHKDEKMAKLENRMIWRSWFYNMTGHGVAHCMPITMLVAS